MNGPAVAQELERPSVNWKVAGSFSVSVPEQHTDSYFIITSFMIVGVAV